MSKTLDTPTQPDYSKVSVADNIRTMQHDTFRANSCNDSMQRLVSVVNNYRIAGEGHDDIVGKLEELGELEESQKRNIHRLKKAVKAAIIIALAGAAFGIAASAVIALAKYKAIGWLVAFLGSGAAIAGTVKKCEAKNKRGKLQNEMGSKELKIDPEKVREVMDHQISIARNTNVGDFDARATAIITQTKELFARKVATHERAKTNQTT